MHRKYLLSLLPLFWLGGSNAALAGDRYAITITNLMPGQEIAPIIAASHKPRTNLFKLGEPASRQLAQLAEEGSTGPLSSLLVKDNGVSSIGSFGGHLQPGKSTEIIIDAAKGFNRISLAAMIIPTNDGFIALDNVDAPQLAYSTVTYYAPVYDAGSEFNDESCRSIPGGYPECASPGTRVSGQPEGFVHIHAGIQGIGDFTPAQRDWKNPAAKITIRRLDD